MEKVWVVFKNYGCEGKSAPLGVYSTPELAEIAAAGGRPYITMEIVELAIDKPVTE